jgi:hypothetical protein
MAAGASTQKLCTRLGNCVAVIAIGLALLGLGVAEVFGGLQVVGALVVVGGLLALLTTMLTADVPT